MDKKVNKIKNLKISVEAHDILKNYCDKNGIKMYRFLEKLIIEKCKDKKDIYGDN
jgi:hypothetical protein